MSMSHRKDPKPEEQTSSFTVDTDEGGASIPTVTRLLDRKKLTLSNTYESKKMPLKSSSKTQLTPAPMKRPSTPPPVPVSPVPRVRSARRISPAGMATSSPIALWMIDGAHASSDSVTALVHPLRTQGLSRALCMTIVGSPSESIFVATKAFGSPTQMTAWSGFRADLKLFPNVLSKLKTDRVVELSPQTKGNEAETSLRTALGVGPAEWLTLFFLEKSGASSMIVVLVSGGTVLEKLRASLPKAA